MGSISKHKVGDLIWDESAFDIGIILAYLPNGIHDSPNFKYSVYHQRSGNRFFYTDEMIEKGKTRLEQIYEREGR
jgi:hypothetical protein